MAEQIPCGGAGINEDDLPAMPKAVYDALYPYSWVDGVRLFPLWSKLFVEAAITMAATANMSEEWAVAWRNKALSQARRIEKLEKRNDLMHELQELMRYTRALHRHLGLPDGDVDILVAANIVQK